MSAQNAGRVLEFTEQKIVNLQKKIEEEILAGHSHGAMHYSAELVAWQHVFTQAWNHAPHEIKQRIIEQGTGSMHLKLDELAKVPS